jgi:excisionase family DNA binding protein
MDQFNLSLTEKYTMSIKEAAAYFGIGQKKLRRLCEENLHDGFAVYSGNRYLIIRTKFEEFLQRTSEI